MNSAEEDVRYWRMFPLWMALTVALVATLFFATRRKPRIERKWVVPRSYFKSNEAWRENVEAAKTAGYPANSMP